MAARESRCRVSGWKTRTFALSEAEAYGWHGMRILVAYDGSECADLMLEDLRWAG
jgi:hypothetical protein